MDNRRAFSRIRTAVLIAGTVGVGTLYWTEGIRPNLVAKRFAVVEEGRIYRSGKVTPAALAAMTNRYGIRTVIDLGAYPEGSPEDVREQRSAESLGVDRVRFDLSGDSTGNANAYVVALRMMNDPARQPVLVHCGAGTERTGCAVILYRHLFQGVPVADAYEEAKSIGHSPGRNEKLQQTLDAWTGPIRDALDSGGQIPGAEPIPEPAPPGGGG